MDMKRKNQNIMQLWKQAEDVISSSTPELLSQLNIKLEELPKDCQQLLFNTTQVLDYTHTETLDSASLTLYKTKEQVLKMEEEYEIIKLKQQNEAAQAKIDRNNKFLEEMRRELQLIKEQIGKNLNGADSAPECTKLLKQKVASYEESCEKTKSKLLKLQVPEGVSVVQLSALAHSLADSRRREDELRARIDDLTLERRARQHLQQLRR